ncbi:hypothetical protein [Actinomadura sp. WAC 06369]|uniref:hypothetical protein n=1 Tax=Actinomadura sp. WAC 06369 TaxID=2203193 RepID=UPI000F771343|nr:hypothetical protein [Actinomadura sp. WAC 06369]RSN69757.1 hypothetical protein DMH08_07755 [Actinomadura sp. WAC 06369]
MHKNTCHLILAIITGLYLMAVLALSTMKVDFLDLFAATGGVAIGTLWVSAAIVYNRGSG